MKCTVDEVSLSPPKCAENMPETVAIRFYSDGRVERKYNAKWYYYGKITAHTRGKTFDTITISTEDDMTVEANIPKSDFKLD